MIIEFDGFKPEEFCLIKPKIEDIEPYMCIRGFDNQDPICKDCVREAIGRENAFEMRFVNKIKEVPIELNNKIAAVAQGMS